MNTCTKCGGELNTGMTCVKCGYENRFFVIAIAPNFSSDIFAWDDANGILKNGTQYLQIVAGDCSQKERRKVGKMIANFLNEVKP